MPSGQAFAGQLAQPVLTLAGAAPGEHVLTVRVTPENLGPVTVQAHIGPDGVRIELFAPTDAGRAAVNAVLPDLRKDLAAGGLGASLDLSDHGPPPDPRPQYEAADQGRGNAGVHAMAGEGDGRRSPAPVVPHLPRAAPPLYLKAAHLDILA